MNNSNNFWSHYTTRSFNNWQILCGGIEHWAFTHWNEKKASVCEWLLTKKHLQIVKIVYILFVTTSPLNLILLELNGNFDKRNFLKSSPHSQGYDLINIDSRNTSVVNFSHEMERWSHSNSSPVTNLITKWINKSRKYWKERYWHLC